MIRSIFSKKKLTDEELTAASDEHCQHVDRLVSENDIEAAISLTQRFQKKLPHNKRGICNAAIAISNAGRPEVAAEILRLGDKANPNEPIMVGNLAAAYYRNGETERAYPFARQSVDLDPRSPYATKLLADILCDLEEFDAAKELCLDFLSKYEQDFMIRFKVGVCDMGLQLYGHAAENFELALELNPEHTSSLANLAGALIGSNEYDRAESVVLQVLEKYPDDGVSLCNHALVYEKRGLNQEAHDLFLRSTEVDPDYEPAFWELDRLRKAMNQGHHEDSVNNRDTSLEDE